FRRPPDAWIDLSTMPRGVSEEDFAASGAHCLDAEPRELPLPLPPPTQSGGFPESAGAWTVYPPCQPTHRTTAPGSCIATRPCREPAPHFRGERRIAERGADVMRRVRLV